MSVTKGISASSEARVWRPLRLILVRILCRGMKIEEDHYERKILCNDNEGLSKLTLECTALLSSARNRSEVLSSQSTINRLIGSISGKNRALRDAVISDNTNAMYMAQSMINAVMQRCVNNTELLSLVNNKINDLSMELSARISHQLQS